MTAARPVHETSRLVVIAATVVVIWALYFARAVLVPFALSVLLTFLLAPLVTRLQRLGLGRLISVVLVIVVSLAVVAAVAMVVGAQIVDLAGKLPHYKDNIREKVDSVRGPLGAALGEATRLVQELGFDVAPASTQPGKLPSGAVARVETVEPAPNAFQVIVKTVGPLLGPLGNAAVVIVFVIFMLLCREDLRDRLIRLVGGGRINVTTQALDDAGKRVSRFLLMMTAINAVHGLVVFLGLLLLGVPNAPLWGLMSALLRFIPYVGPWLAAAMPITLSIAVFDNWTQPLLIIGFFILLEIVSNNVLEPWLYGASTGVSPVAVLAAAVFWTWLWGAAGLLMATPLTVCLVVMGKYVPQLSFLNVLLGDEPVLPPATHLYQRLLSRDYDEAAELAEEQLKTRPLVEVYDSLLAPALGLAERDRHSGQLDEERLQFVHRSMRELVEDLGERAVAKSGESTDGPNVRHRSGEPLVLCLPARDAADELAALMMTQILQHGGLSARTVSADSLAGEMMDEVQANGASIICISALPPSAITHARYLCKRLRARFGQMNIVVGLWTVQEGTARAERRLECGEHCRVVTSFADALRELQVLSQRRELQTPTGREPEREGRLEPVRGSA